MSNIGKTVPIKIETTCIVVKQDQSAGSPFGAAEWFPIACIDDRNSEKKRGGIQYLDTRI